MFNRKYTSSNSGFSIIIIMLVFRVVVFGDVVFTNPKKPLETPSDQCVSPTYSSADLTASPGRMVAKDLGMSIRRYKKNKNCWVILLMVQKSSVHQLGGDNRINKKNSKVKSSVCASLLIPGLFVYVVYGNRRSMIFLQGSKNPPKTPKT